MRVDENSIQAGRIAVEKARTFQDVILWQKAHKWVLGVYQLTNAFPKEERFGLTAQLRDAATSVPANFAEGFRKKGKADKLRYYNIAQGSLSESHYFLILAKDLAYGDTSELIEQLREVDIMLDAYMKTIERGRGRASSRGDEKTSR